MIRKGSSLHTLYPAGLEDHLAYELVESDLNLCLQACSLPRWFSLPMLECALNDILPSKIIKECYKQIVGERYIRRYGNLGHYLSDSERYFFLNFAFTKTPGIGSSVLANLLSYFRNQQVEMSAEYRTLAERGYYDAAGIFRIEELHLSYYNSEKHIDSITLESFDTFQTWRSDPIFNHGLNRRLIKAIRDHLRTDLINDESSLAILSLMQYSTPPWNTDHLSKTQTLKNHESALKQFPSVLPHYYLERAKAEWGLAQENESIVELFSLAKEGFKALGSTYYEAEACRQKAKFLTHIDLFVDADRTLKTALRLLEKARSPEGNTFSTTIDECWRLISWNYYYSGEGNLERAKEIAEKQYAKLKRSGKRYMTALYGILVSKIRTSDPDFLSFGNLFFDTLDILEEAIQYLIVVPDSMDYPNALFQKTVLQIEYLENSRARSAEREEIVAEVLQRMEEIRHYYESLSSIQGVANLTYWEGKLKFLLGDYRDAIRAFEAALETYEASSDSYGRFNALCRLGVTFALAGMKDDAFSALSKARAIARDKNWIERYDKTLSLAMESSASHAAAIEQVDGRIRGG